MYDPVSHLVYVTRGDDVRTTVVNGKVLMRDRRVLTLDRRGGARRGARVRGQGPGGRQVSHVNQQDPHLAGGDPAAHPDTRGGDRARLSAERRDPPRGGAQGRVHVHGGPGPRDERPRHDGFHGGVELRQGDHVVRPGARAEGSRQQPRGAPRDRRRGHRRHRAHAPLPAGPAEGARPEDR